MSDRDVVWVLAVGTMRLSQEKDFKEGKSMLRTLTRSRGRYRKRAAVTGGRYEKRAAVTGGRYRNNALGQDSPTL
jgi:hypothetical protein